MYMNRKEIDHFLFRWFVGTEVLHQMIRLRCESRCTKSQLEVTLLCLMITLILAVLSSNSLLYILYIKQM